MVRILTLIGFAMIVSAIFAAMFLNESGERCLPPTVFGVPPPSNAIAATYKGFNTDLAVLNALVAAAGSPAPSKTYKATFSSSADLTSADDIGAYCHSKKAVLLVEVAASILLAVGVWFWLLRRRIG